MLTLHIDLGKQWRGGQSQALLLMKGLRACGHEAELLSWRGSPLAKRAEAEGIRVHAVEKPFVRLRAATKLASFIAQRRPEIVHTHEAHALTAAWLARASRRTGLIASRRLAYALQQNYISLARYRSAARILAVSKFVAESLADLGIESRSVAVVYDGVEVPTAVSPEERLQARRRWKIGDEERLLGCVGYLLPEKGQEILVRAWPEVLKRSGPCRLLLAGDGASRSQLEALARELGVAEAILFPGFVENVAGVYAALDGFLFPSLAEPLGSSMLAALAYGLPTVALARGAVPEVITDGETGWLVGGPDPPAFAAAVARLLNDPALAARLGAAARRTIERNFSADRMVDETLRVYGQVCEEQRKSGRAGA
jgi:glycosyltransferase involved in cell wall biosynthesis